MRFFIREIRRMLQEDVPEGTTALGEISRRGMGDPFKVLIATILSHRTRDENTNKAFQQLFSTYKDAKELSEADDRQIQELIKPSGFYHVKAKRIKEVSRMILEKYKGRVPSDLEELLSLPSVGRKTANCVLVYGFGKPAIPVDTHVHRIVNRLGFVNAKTPDETEFELMKKVDRKYWMDINELFVRFGQRICKPVIPRCNECRLRSVCRWYQKFGRQIYEKNRPRGI
ncbi:MAG: endonuclease III [Nitrososphaerales archaeon]|nr:endonuclease III [Nitrososphaerales archaeon]